MFFKLINSKKILFFLNIRFCMSNCKKRLHPQIKAFKLVGSVYAVSKSTALG